MDFLAGTALFHGCERKTVEKLIPHVFPVQVPVGIIIVRAGTPDPGIGVLYQGRAAIRLTDAATGAQITLEEIGVGEPFGEVGAFLGTAQPHDVVALQDSVMFLLGHDVVAQLATKPARVLDRRGAAASRYKVVADRGVAGGRLARARRSSVPPPSPSPSPCRRPRPLPRVTRSASSAHLGATIRRRRRPSPRCPRS